jgi:hypothetical protein
VVWALETTSKFLSIFHRPRPTADLQRDASCVLEVGEGDLELGETAAMLDLSWGGFDDQADVMNWGLGKTPCAIRPTPRGSVSQPGHGDLRFLVTMNYKCWHLRLSVVSSMIRGTLNG